MWITAWTWWNNIALRRVASRRRILAFGFLTCALAGGVVSAQDAMVQSFPLPLQVESPGGRALIVVNAQVDMDMQLRALEAAPIVDLFSGVLNQEAFTGLQSAAEDGWLAGDELDPLGLSLRFDPAELAASLSAPLEVLAIQLLPVQSERPVPPFPEAANARVSIAFPLWSQFVHRLGGDDGNDVSYRVRGGPGLSFDEWVLESDLQALYDQGVWSGDLENTRIVRTWNDPGIQIQAGQILQWADGLVPAERVLGIAVDNLQADARRDTVPVILDRPLTVEAPSTIDVYINARRTRSFPVQPGRYSVVNIPLTAGVNQVWVELIDARGGVERYDAIIPHSSDLLETGAWQYAASIGVEEREPTRPVFGGFVQYGLAESLRVEALGKVSTRGAQIGTAGVAATTIGELSAGGYLTYPFEIDTGLGWAGEASYRFHLLARPALPVLGLSIRYQAPSFVVPLPEATAGEQAMRVGTTLSQPLPGEIGLSVSHVYQTFHDGSPAESRLSFGMSRRLGRVLSIRGAGYFDTTDPAGSWGASITIASRNGRNGFGGTAVWDVDAGTASLSGSGSWDGPVEVDAGVGVRDVAIDRGSVNGFYANADASHPRGSVGINGTLSMAGSEPIYGQGIDSGSYSVRLDTGLYFADGAFGIGEAQRASFALVRPAPDLPAESVAVRRSSSSTNALRSGVLGAAVVGSMQPGTPQTVSVDVPALPADYSLGPTDWLVRPGYRSGALVEIRYLRYLYARGRLVGPGGEAIGYTPLLVSPTFEVPAEYQIDGEQSLGGMAFSDESGVFDTYGLIPGTYHVGLQDGSGREFWFSVPDQDQPLYDIGEIVVEDN